MGEWSNTRSHENQYVQRLDVAVADGFLALRVLRDALDGQVNFYEAFGVHHAECRMQN